MDPADAPLGWPVGVYNPVKKYHSTPYPEISPSLPALSSRGKKVLITGGGAGIGLAISNAFATAGASKITIIGRTLSSLESIKASIEERASGTKVTIYAASLTDYAAVTAMFNAERAAHGEFDIVVLCAGYLQSAGSALAVTNEDYANSFDLNVHANINAVRQYLKVPSTPEKPKTIVDISTSVTHAPSPVMAIYHVTKSAFSYYMAQLDLEFRDAGLKIFSVHPGTVWTGMALRAGLKETDLPFDHGMGILSADNLWEHILIIKYSGPSWSICCLGC